MKITKLMLMMLCLVGTLAFVAAQDGATPQVAPTQNLEEFEKFPECRMYAVYYPENGGGEAATKELIDKIDSLTSVAAIHDRNASKFDTKQEAGTGVSYGLIVWDGFLPIKKAGTYTFLVTRPEIGGGQAVGLRVNNTYGYQACWNDPNQLTVNVDLKIGMNRLRFFVWAYKASALQKASPLIRYKLMNVVGDFREFTPANLFHKIETAEW